MNDPVGVSLCEPFAGLEDVVDSLGYREWTAGHEELREILPFEILEDHEGDAVIERAELHDARDVLAVEACRRARFVEEALQTIRVLVRIGEQELDGHST